MRKERNMSLDLLRIISMLMVVWIHSFSHGGLFEALTPGSVNWYGANVLNAFGMVAVNCFVLLSGYFQCTSRFRLKRVASVWAQALFYSVGLYLLVVALTGEFSVMTMVQSVLVMTTQRYWFVTAYLLMYLVSPFLNCAIRAMDRRKHLICCGVLLLVFSVLHNLVYIFDFGYIRGGNSMLWFCVLYMISAYIRLYVPAQRKHRSGYWIYAGCVAVIAGERFAAYYITTRLLGYCVGDSLFYSYNAVPMVTASVALFMAVRTVNIKDKAGKFVGFLVPLVFGVYLIHDHPTIRPLLWNWLQPAAYVQSVWLVPYWICYTVGIFAVCCAIEWIRQKLFALCRIDRAVESVSDWIQKKVNEKIPHF